MSVSKLWTNYPVKLHTATAQSGGAVYCKGIRSLGFSSGLQTGVEGGDDDFYNTFGSLRGGAYRATFSTTDLKTFLDECGVTGMLIDSGVNPGVEIYFSRMAAGGTRDANATATHWKGTIADGILVPRGIELSHGGVAMLSAEAVAIESAGAAGMVFAESAALPSGVNGNTSVIHTLGKVDLNGTQIQGVSSVSIDFGIQLVADRRDSDLFPSFVSIAKIQPRITLRGVHIDDTATYTENGAYIASGVVIYARKRAEGGTFVADGTAEHVSFTLGKCRVDVLNAGGSPKELSLVLTPWNTAGGTAPLTINTATAIS